MAVPALGTVGDVRDGLVTSEEKVMHALNARQGTILGVGLGVALFATAALSMSPRAPAEASGLRRGEVARAGQAGAMPTNDDFRFRPVMQFASTGGAPCPEDVDGSGDVGFDDVLALLSAWGPCSGCVEDLDGSGEVGFDDLLQTLSAWGPCP